MQRVYLLIFWCAFEQIITAQNPQKMSYQAVVRNASNALVANTTRGMRVSILLGNEFGAAVLVETHRPLTLSLIHI